LKQLPGIIEDLLSQWDCVADGPVMHGQVGVIVPVRSAAGPAVLKVSFPHPGNVHEPDRERVRRWAHLHVVQAAFHGRRRGFGRARGGAYLDRILALVDQLAVSWC
jgi:streptomycin 6-kinase